MGGYLNYMDVFVYSNLKQIKICLIYLFLLHFSTNFIFLPFLHYEHNNIKYCFWTFNRSISNGQFSFYQIHVCNGNYKQRFTIRKKLKKTYIYTLKQDLSLFVWFINIMKETLKSTQDKQIFSILYHINCPSKYLLE